MKRKRTQQLLWRCRDRDRWLGPRTLIMGVINVTPDSFSDGGAFMEPGPAIRHGIRLAGDGADILDVGGESTRPGAEPVPVEEEARRVLPVVERLVRETDCLISIDTTKADVARRALAQGAHVVNDVSALREDEGMARCVAEYGAGVILMHRQGIPRTMQVAPHYQDVVREVTAFLEERLRFAEAAGICMECIAVDPGIGFGKTMGHNLELLRGLGSLSALERPIAIGVSRKSFLGTWTGRDVNDRLAASLAAMVHGILSGAHIVRVHDVKESCDAARVIDIMRQEETDDAGNGRHSRIDILARTLRAP